MADIKHQHNDNDIIIKDQDGSYKILRDGKFVPLDQGEAKAHGLDASSGPKRAPDAVKPTTPVAPKTAAPVQSEQKRPPASGEVRGFADQDLQKQAELYLGKSGVTFASGEIRGRAIKALIPHLKGIRKPYETKANLVKSVQEGGVGLSESEADRLLSAAGVMISTPKSAVKPVSRPANPVAKPMRQAVGKEISAPARVAFNQLSAGEDTPYFPLKPTSSVIPTSKPAVTARPAVSDIVRPSRAVGGPVDELGYDLTTWRRLGTNPVDRIKKIESQLDLLEQDGYAQRLKGIASWRHSEVVSLYLSSGKKSLEEGQPLQQLLGEGNANMLSMQEWLAVNTLDSRLMS
jgi:hypothetical protein